MPASTFWFPPHGAVQPRLDLRLALPWAWQGSQPRATMATSQVLCCGLCCPVASAEHSGLQASWWPVAEARCLSRCLWSLNHAAMATAQVGQDRLGWTAAVLPCATLQLSLQRMAEPGLPLESALVVWPLSGGGQRSLHSVCRLLQRWWAPVQCAVRQCASPTDTDVCTASHSTLTVTKLCWLVTQLSSVGLKYWWGQTSPRLCAVFSGLFLSWNDFPGRGVRSWENSCCFEDAFPGTACISCCEICSVPGSRLPCPPHGCLSS